MSLAGRALQAVSRLHALRLVAAHDPTRALRAAGLPAPLAGRWVPTPAARLALPFRALARGGSGVAMIAPPRARGGGAPL